MSSVVLHGRLAEQTVIDALLGRVRQGLSGALVITGEPGIGKTALLGYAAAHSDGMRVLRGTGVESEAELAFAGLHLLLGPVLDHRDRLPDPQRMALSGALGLGPAEAGDRFLIALAVLSLLSELAEERPLVCLLDDVQWLDRASATVLQFVARRLEGEGAAMLFAARDGEPAFAGSGIAEMRLGGLDAGPSTAPAPSSSMANGCGGHGARTRRRSSCPPPWAPSHRSARPGGATGPVRNCMPPGPQCRTRRGGTCSPPSPHRSSRSPSSRPAACPTGTSPRSCSSAPRTVAYHLYKAYPKLGIAGRSEIPALLADAARSADAAYPHRYQ